MSAIHLRLPILRAERGLSQRQLAARAGLRADTISALERGQSNGIQFDTLARLCEVLECQPGEILEIERDSHRLPLLGGPEEDALLGQRLQELEAGQRIDGPTFMAELQRLADHDAPRGGRRR
ncbi:MAG: helix-turn-helix domain-containing protein [Dehalococcoidia bacterium]